jgi:hypothetical protein
MRKNGDVDPKKDQKFANEGDADEIVMGREIL